MQKHASRNIFRIYWYTYAFYDIIIENMRFITKRIDI